MAELSPPDPSKREPSIEPPAAPPNVPGPVTPPAPPSQRFLNEPIPVDDLPRLADEAFVPVDPRYLRTWLASIAAIVVVVAVAAGVLAGLVDRPAIVLGIAGVVLLLLVAAAGFSVLEVRRLGYQLREHDLSLRRGVLTHTVETVPFARVQHVRVNRGPVERMLGLATLEVNSAGPDISIPGLALDDANRIKVLVTERAGVSE